MDEVEVNGLINYLNITHVDDIELDHDDVELIVLALDYYKGTYKIG